MLRPVRALAAAAALAALVLPAGAAAADDPLTGRLLVTLEPDAGATPTAHASTARAVAARAGARTAAAPIPELDLAVLRPAAGTALSALAATLRRDPRVAAVRAERRATLRYEPNDPALTRQAPGAPAGITEGWWIPRQGLPAAWETTRGTDAVVAVIDTGVAGDHPDLQGRLLPGADFDDDPTHPGGADVDEVGHGTHVASLACGAADNGTGIAGAGFGCKVLPIKSDLSESSIARSILFATEQGVDAIVMSFGTTGERPAAQAVADALRAAYDRGIVMAAAAADDPVEEQGDPANVLQPTGTGSDLAQGIGLTVTAADLSGGRASFAGRGSQISLAAYGSLGTTGPPGILGAFPGPTVEIERGSLLPPMPGCQCRTAFDGDRRYAYLQGTSMATPMVAAVGALVRDLNPDLSVAEVLRIVKETARRPAGAGWDPEVGWGVLDGGAAVGTASQADRRPPTSRARRAARRATIRATRFTLRLSGRDAGPPGVRKSGVSRFEVFRSVDGGRYRRVARTSRTTLRLTGRRGARYRFYAVAVDRAGNREAAPARPDTAVTIRRR